MEKEIKSLQHRKTKQLAKRTILIIGAIGLVKLIGISSDIVLAQSRSQCEQYARDYAKRNSRSHTLRGAAGGAAGGAIIGAIFGKPGRGAGIGAIVGVLEGGSRESSDYQRLYYIAYDDCIRGRVRLR